MFGIGMTELMVIFVVGLVVLGPKRLPELARSLGRSLAEFRRASTDLRREFMDVADDARIDLNAKAIGEEGETDSPTGAKREREPRGAEGYGAGSRPAAEDEETEPSGG